MKNNSLIPLLFGLSFLFVYSCNGNDNEKSNKDTLIDSDVDDNVTFYLIPSAKDLFTVINSDELSFNDSVLCEESVDSEDSEKYQSFVLGVYLADLSYSAVFSENETTKHILKKIFSIAENIKIYSISDEINHSDSLVNEKDTLIKISNELYGKIVADLENHNRNTTLSFISAGNWIQCMYILVNLVETYSENDALIQLIADQKDIVEYLFMYLEKRSDENSSISFILNELKPLEKIYLSLKTIKTNVDTTAPEKTYIVGSSVRILLDEQQFRKLKTTIISIRNKMSDKNVYTLH